MQEARHAADYDLSIRLTRSEARDLVRRVATVFAAWDSIRDHDATKLFLLSLLLGKQWKI